MIKILLKQTHPSTDVWKKLCPTNPRRRISGYPFGGGENRPNFYLQIHPTIHFMYTQNHTIKCNVFAPIHSSCSPPPVRSAADDVLFYSMGCCLPKKMIGGRVRWWRCIFRSCSSCGGGLRATQVAPIMVMISLPLPDHPPGIISLSPLFLSPSFLVHPKITFPFVVMIWSDQGGPTNLSSPSSPFNTHQKVFYYLPTLFCAHSYHPIPN